MTNLIPSTADAEANAANMAAIDAIEVGEYACIRGWAKLLGFSADWCDLHSGRAAQDKAPVNAIQNIDGLWLTLESIRNPETRARVVALSEKGAK